MKGLIHITMVSRALLLSTAALFTCGVPALAWAQDNWSNPGTGDWFVDGNWADGTTPTAADDANIDNGGTAQVEVAGAWAREVLVGDFNSGFLEIISGGTLSSALGNIGSSGGTGAVTVTGAGSAWTNSSLLGIGNLGSGTLTIGGGGTVSNTSGFIGANTGGTGAVTVTGTGSVWTNSSNLLVGSSGDGTLTLGGGGTVAAGGNVRLAQNTSGSGTLNVGNGVGAGILNAAVVEGGAGTATLNFIHTDTDYFFTNDGTASGTAIDITGSTAVNHFGAGTTILIGANTYNGGTTITAGTLDVDGGSIAHPGVALNVGVDGNEGALLIQNGGAVSNGIVRIGFRDGTGAVTVTGTGSVWTNSSTLAAGFSGDGTLTITDGGTVSSGRGAIGDAGGRTGAVTVTGAGSTWTNLFASASNPLYVGRGGDGTLTIVDGGAVSNAASAVIGLGTASTGTVAVTGASSAWTNDGSLAVGSNGSGTLTVENGGSISNNAGFVGGFLNGSIADLNIPDGTGTGTATVTGAGSTWTNDSFLYVGIGGGDGTLTIADGGTTNSNFSFIGTQDGTGEVTVTGASSTWDNLFLRVGQNGGSGTLTIENGGAVSSRSQGGSVVESAIGIGTVTVTGMDSTWTNDGNLHVGFGGSFGSISTLTIADGGRVSNLNGFAGFNTNGTAVVTVTDAGSIWENSETLEVGNRRTGTLIIENGGRVSSNEGVIGFASVGASTVTVTGAGSEWSNTLTLTVGSARGEDNTLTIEDGARVTAGGNVTLGEIDGSGFGSSGMLNIGAGGAAGILDTTTVNGETDGSATLNFNHTDADYVFTNDGTAGGTAIAITGTTAVNHVGIGVTILTGTNTYTGPTVIDAGALLVDGSIANSATTVNDGGTLGGTGITGAVTVNAGGVLSPGSGAGAGTLTTGDLTLNDTSALAFELGAPGTTGSGVSDHLVVDGNLILDGMVDVTALGGFGLGTYTLISYTGDLIADNGLAIGSLPAGFSAVIDTNTTSGEVTMTVMPPAPAVGLTPAALDFGDVELDQTSAAQTVTLENVGNADLSLGTLTVSGVHAGEFALAADACSGQLIAPAGTCSFNVAFTPAASGIRNAQIDIPSNAPESPHALSVAGTGVLPPPELSLMPGFWDFGDVQLGGTALSDPFVVDNTGGSDLVVGMVTIEGPAAGDFQIEDDICSGQTVAPGDFCGFSVRFTPTAAGIRHAEVHVPANAPESPGIAVLIGAQEMVFSDGFEGD